MRRFSLLLPLALVLLVCLAGPAARPAAATELLDVMGVELDRSMANLANAGPAPLYYLQYAVTERSEYELSATNGGLNAPSTSLHRYLDVDLRVGSMELDNTHEIRSNNWRDNYVPQRMVPFPLDADPGAVRAALWNETEYQFQKAQERLTKVEANRQVKVEEEDLSDDFSPGGAHAHTESVVLSEIEEQNWQGILKRVGEYLAQFDFVHNSSARLSIDDRTIYMVNSEGSRLQHSNHYLRVSLSVRGMAEDGMDLYRSEGYSAASVERLPDEATLMADAERLVGELAALIDAPIVEPYIGPAILMNRASGVFFHEIFGHRIEGHRQKSESEGQTFTKKVGEQILPEFISVYDDPTLAEFEGTDLRGYYRFDDEGTPAQRVTVVDKGVLKNFLTSRSPIEGFPTSNGHGRREPGNDVVARQGNLIIHSDKQVSYPELREMLIEECQRQGKPYGLVFEDISGGFTSTGRRGPQAFKVLPLLVTRVYADGRPDEVVRGVDIVGTPLTSFSKILMAADDSDVFNGTCGAESGWCPVSGVSPSILVSEIEVEKRQKRQDKPPILPAAGAGQAAAGGAAPSAEGTSEVIFRAMQDEMDRSMSDLRIEGMPAPYFLSYRVMDTEEVTVEARYGALVETEEAENRYFYGECRVGDPALDNSNYIGSWRDLYNMRDGLVEEDDYEALRHQIWLLTDGAYKNALENLAGKQSYLQAHPPKEEIPDFSEVDPYTRVGEPVSLEVDLEGWQADVRAAADALGEYSALQDWRVSYRAWTENRHYLNSEGSRHLTGAQIDVIEVVATAQAEDGQRLTSFLRFGGRDGQAPIKGAALVSEVKEMASELEAMVAAPSLDEYVGPVLFDDFAAAQFVSQLFAAQLSPTRAPMSDQDWIRSSLPDPKLAGRVNRRVFPEFITVVDDPLKVSWEGTNLVGHRLVDDEGVPTETVTLVDEGRLVALPMGRQPTKKIPESNGHAYTFENQWTAPVVSNLFVKTERPEKDLMKRLRQLCDDFGTEYGLLVTRLEDPTLSREYRWTEREEDSQPLLSAPVGMYKIYAADGRIEPVRGLVFDEVSIRTLRDVAALGAEAEAYNLRQPLSIENVYYPAAVVTPDILVEEMELEAGSVREPVPITMNPIFGQ